MSTEEPLVQADADIDVSLDGMTTVHLLLDRFWSDIARSTATLPGYVAESLFSSAVAEIAGNVVRHAYQSPNPGATFHVTLTRFADRLLAVLTDRGAPYDYAPADRPPDMRFALDDPELDHGWGLPIAHAASDELCYERLPEGINRWSIEKRLPT